MLILAGLGNPGPKHANQRHNVGFMALDAIHDRWRFAPWRGRFQGFAAEGAVDTPAGAVRALLLKPQTFMNDSGRAVGEAARFYKTPTAQVVAAYDEIDLAPGRFRTKTGGGAAGHNGVRSMAAHIGPDFRRARIGVGHPGTKERVMGHVLSDFHKADRAWLDPLLGALADALPLLLAGEDERYQAEVMRLAPSPNFDSRSRNRDQA